MTRGSELITVRAVYQMAAKASGTVAKEVSAMLMTLPFPQCPPPSLRDAKDYHGFKLVRLPSGELASSYFFFADEKDEFGRSVASARVCVIGKEQQIEGRWGVGEAMEKLEKDDLENGTHLVVLDESEKIIEAIKAFNKIPIDAVAEILTRLGSRESLQIYSRDETLAREVFTLIFGLMPFSILQHISISTYADRPAGDQEQLIFLRTEPTVEKKGFFSKLLGGGHEGPTRVHPAHNWLVEGKGLSGTEKRIKMAFVEMIEGNLEIPWKSSERFSLLQDYIETKLLGEKYDWMKTAPGDILTNPELLEKLMVTFPA